ncbi:MAG: hypothetical protein WAR79_02355, partial [Melioribacteraceae bacterium]
KIFIIIIISFIQSCSENNLIDEENIGNGRIDLNGSIENIIIGMDSLSVINKFGEPDYYGIADIIIENIILGYHTDKQGVIEVTLFEDYVIDSVFAVFGVIVKKGYLGTAKNGLGIGSKREEVSNLLGTEISYDVPNGLSQFNTRFIFNYDEEDRVNQITMVYNKN